MANIIEASQLPEEEKVYLKKDFLGWRVVEPWKNPETGKVNWFNLIFGGKRALFVLCLLAVIVLFFYLGYQEIINDSKTIIENPCTYCNSTSKVLFTGG